MISRSQSCSVKCQNKDRSRHFGTYLGISAGFPERRLDGFYFPAYSPYIVLHTHKSRGIYFRGGVYLLARSWEETTRHLASTPLSTSLILFTTIVLARVSVEPREMTRIIITKWLWHFREPLKYLDARSLFFEISFGSWMPVVLPGGW